jgi:hypothetical protein
LENTTLRHIDITDSNTHIADSMKMFGNLGHLMALRTLSLHFYDHFSTDDNGMTDAAWADLDGSSRKLTTR